MALQDFTELTAEPSLLRQVELIVLDSHRRLYAEKGQAWSEPIAYHWLRYEDPMPVARLGAGLQRLLLRVRRWTPTLWTKRAQMHGLGDFRIEERAVHALWKRDAPRDL